jgi:hypothetical protein
MRCLCHSVPFLVIAIRADSLVLLLIVCFTIPVCLGACLRSLLFAIPQNARGETKPFLVQFMRCFVLVHYCFCCLLLFALSFCVLHYTAPYRYLSVRTAGYLNSREEWDAYDATALLRTGTGVAAYDDILVDVGTSDSFLQNGQLRPEVRYCFVRLILLLVLFCCRCFSCGSC